MTLTDIDRLNIHIKLLTSRLDALEEMVRKNKPAPQRDTSWVPYKVGDEHPEGNERVAIILRGSDEVMGPAASDASGDGDDFGDRTIVAWRYAKEGE